MKNCFFNWLTKLTKWGLNFPKLEKTFIKIENII